MALSIDGCSAEMKPEVPGVTFVRVVAPGSSTCTGSWRLTTDPGRLRGALLILDSERAVRRISRRAEITAEVRCWLEGRATFQSQCARCHGEDGRDVSYAGTKSLGGIGRLHSEEEILALTERSGFVDLSYLGVNGKRALAAFVAGL